MAAPTGNTAGAKLTNYRDVNLPRDVRDALSAIERIAAAGYANSDLANVLAAMTYSNTGNFGHPSGRYSAKGVTYNGNTSIQNVIGCFNDVLLANT